MLEGLSVQILTKTTKDTAEKLPLNYSLQNFNMDLRQITGTDLYRAVRQNKICSEVLGPAFPMSPQRKTALSRNRQRFNFLPSIDGEPISPHLNQIPEHFGMCFKVALLQYDCGNFAADVKRNRRSHCFIPHVTDVPPSEWKTPAASC